MKKEYDESRKIYKKYTLVGVKIEGKLDKEDVYKYTMQGNTVAIISDGIAVIGLGYSGSEAAYLLGKGK